MFVPYIKEKKSKIRDEQMIALAESGLTFAEIGRRYSLSRERVRQICTGHKRKKKSPFYGLSTATANILMRAGVMTKDDLIEKLKEGFYVRKVSDIRLNELSNYVGHYIVGFKQNDGTRLVKYWEKKRQVSRNDKR